MTLVSEIVGKGVTPYSSLAAQGQIFAGPRLAHRNSWSTSRYTQTRNTIVAASSKTMSFSRIKA